MGHLFARPAPGYLPESVHQLPVHRHQAGAATLPGPHRDASDAAARLRSPHSRFRASLADFISNSAILTAIRPRHALTVTPNFGPRRKKWQTWRTSLPSLDLPPSFVIISNTPSRLERASPSTSHSNEPAPGYRRIRGPLHPHLRTLRTEGSGHHVEPGFLGVGTHLCRSDGHRRGHRPGGHHSVILEFHVSSYHTDAAQQRGQAEEVNRQN